MSYFKYLTAIYGLLVSAGSRVPLVLAALQQLVDDLQTPALSKQVTTLEADLQSVIVAAIGHNITIPKEAIPEGPDNPCILLEQHIGEVIVKHNKGATAVASGQGAGPFIALIQQLWQIVQSNPALMQILVTLITNLLKPPVAVA